MQSLSLSTSVDDAVFFLVSDPWTFAELLCDDCFVGDSVVVSDFHPVQAGLCNPYASRSHVLPFQRSCYHGLQPSLLLLPPPPPSMHALITSQRVAAASPSLSLLSA